MWSVNLPFKFQLLAFASSRKLRQEVSAEMGSSVVKATVRRTFPIFLNKQQREATHVIKEQPFL